MTQEVIQFNSHRCAFCDPSKDDRVILVIKCRDGDVPLGENCYKIFNEKFISWNEDTKFAWLQEWFESSKSRRMIKLSPEEEEQFSITIPVFDKTASNTINGSTIKIVSKPQKTSEEIEEAKVKQIARRVRRGKGHWLKQIQVVKR